MNNPNLYIPPSNKVPAWMGWILGVGFVGIILASGTVVLKHVSPAQAAGSVDAVAPAAAPSAAPSAAAAVAAEDDKDDAAPAVAVAVDDALVAAAPRAKAKGKHGGKAVKIARASKSKPTKTGARHYTQERSAKILAKHDNNSTRQSKQKLDRLLGL